MLYDRLSKAVLAGVVVVSTVAIIIVVFLMQPNPGALPPYQPASVIEAPHGQETPEPGEEDAVVAPDH